MIAVRLLLFAVDMVGKAVSKARKYTKPIRVMKSVVTPIRPSSQQRGHEKLAEVFEFPKKK
jgi:hypothetical protein